MLSSYVKPVAPQAKKIAGATPIETITSGTDVNYYYNECTGEWVEYTETWTSTTRGVINKNKVTYSFHYTDDIEGVGLTTGNTYHGHGKLNHVVNDSFNGESYTSNFVATQIITTPGGGNNSKADLTIKVTVNANGDVVVDRLDGSFTCQ